MSSATGRRAIRPRPMLEALEARALLANAGAPDPTFGTLGSVTLPIQGTVDLDSARGNNDLSAAAPGGKIVLVGSYPASSGLAGVLVERLDADGSPDPTFGTGGLAVVKQGVTSPQALAVQPDGSILVAGPIAGSTTTYGVTRLGPNGSIDTSFGTGGVASLPALGPGGTPIAGFSSLTITPDGGILVAGDRQGAGRAGDFVSEIFVARFSAAGMLDTSFGSVGVATVPITLGAFTVAEPSTVVVQPSGRVVVAGEAEEATTTFDGSGASVMVPVVAGLTASGRADPGFGATSPGLSVIAPTTLGGVSVRSSPGMTFDDMVMRPDGSLLLEATSQYGPIQSGALASLTADGSPGTSTFGGTDGVVSIGPLVPEGVALEGDGKIVLPGYVPGSDATSPIISQPIRRFAVAQFDPDGVPDPAFGQPATPGLEAYPTPAVMGELDFASADDAGHLILTGTLSSPALAGTTLSGLQVFRADLAPAPSSATAQPPADFFSDDSKTDLAVYLPASATFASLSTTSSGYDGFSAQFGVAGPGQTIPAVADYDGLGHAQVAAYLTASGLYAIAPTATSPGLLLPFGIPGAGNSIPAPGDYLGTGKADLAVYLPALADFAILPTGGAAGEIVHFGIAGAGNSIPVPADYDGTGHDDIAVYLPQVAAFAVQDPTGKTPGEVVPFGLPGAGRSIPVPGDYDGSGHAEFAVYEPSVGAFFYQPYLGGAQQEVKLGTPNSGEIPVPGDYDGSGHDEFAIYDPAKGFFEYLPADGGLGVIPADGGAGVIVPFGPPDGASVPVLAPPGSSSGSVSGLAVRSGSPTPAPAPSASGASPSAITLGKASALPAGPSLSPAPARVARSLVNQGADDPSAITR